MSESIPDSWALLPLSEAGRWGSGGTPKRTEPAYYEGGTIPWLVIGDLTDGAVSHAETHITRLGLENSSAKLIAPGAILVAMYGSIGKLGINTIECATNQAIAYCTPETRLVEPKYLFNALMADRKRLIDQGKGGAQQNISQEILKAHEIPLAPLPEQRRIVAKLDALQSRTRLAREALAAIPALLDHYRQSVLAAAFRGELTADWRQQHDVTHVTAATPGDQELPDLPTGWAWRRIGDLGRNGQEAVQTGPFGAQLHSDEFVAEGVPVIAVGNLTGIGFTTDGLYFVTKQKAEQLARYDVNAGDLLFARSGATLGKVCVAPAIVQNWRMTGHILRVRLDSAVISSDLVAFALSGCPPVVEMVKTGIRGMTRPGYNTSLLAAIPVPVPPTEEQALMLKRVQALFSRIDEIASLHQRTATAVGHLDQSLLATAFRGELVPQDPADEPASVLLDRIRTARAQAGDAPRTRRPRTPAAAPPPARAAEPARPYRAAASDPYATLLSSLRSRGSLASSDAQTATGLDAAAVRPLLQRLVAEGAAKVEGQKRGTRYVAT